MKIYLHHLLSIAFALITFSSCQSDPFGTITSELTRELTALDEGDIGNKNVKIYAQDSLSVFLKSLSACVETFTFNGEKSALFTTSKGTDFDFSNAVFVNKKGEIISRNVTIAVYELHTPSDMILADMPTNTLRKDGYLDSYGEFKVTASHEGQSLDLQSGSSIVVATERNQNGKTQSQKIPIWDADTTDIFQQFKGLNHLAEPTSVTQIFREKRGAAWTETPQSAEENEFNRLQFELVSLNKWKNCDIFLESLTAKTTVFCHFAENLPPSVFEGETATKAAAIYFKPLNINALIKFYHPILNAPLTKSGFYSEENSVPIGTQGTLIAVSFLSGKLYVDQQNVTVKAPSKNERATFFTMHPVETDPSVFLRNIRLL
jgi:hypothetical protein